MSQLVFIAAMLFGAAFLPSTSLADGRVITNIDGLSLNPSAIGANFISDTGYNTSATDRSNNYVYQAAGKMEFVLRAEFHFSYGVPDGCFLAGETLEVLAVDFVTADAQHAHVSTVDPSTVSVTTNGNVAEIRFPFDPYDPANGGSGLPKRYYEIVPKVTLRGTATYGNLACTPFSPLPYTATLETGLVLFPTKYMVTEIDEQDRVVKVKLSSFSLVAANVYLGVGFTEKPVIGEVIRPSSAGGKMIFSPSQAATEEYWGGGSLAWYGQARFNYYTPEQFVRVPAVDPPLPADLDNPVDPSASTAEISDNVAIVAEAEAQLRYETLVKNYFVNIDTVDGDVTAKMPGEISYSLFPRNTKFPPGTILRLRSSFDPLNNLVLPYVKLSFYDRSSGEAQGVGLPYESQNSGVYLRLGAKGIEENRDCNIFADFSNFVKESTENPAELARFAFIQGAGFAAATAFGPMGFLAKAAGGTTMKYVLNKALDYPAPLPDQLRLKVPNPWQGGVDSSGSQSSYLIEGYLSGDGSVKVAGRAGSVVAKSSSASAIIPFGTQVIFNSSTMLPGAPQRIPNLPSGNLLPIEIKPASGETLDSTLGCVRINYPLASTIPSFLNSLTVRLNQVLISDNLYPGDFDRQFIFQISQGAVYCPRAETPLALGANTLKASITTMGGRRSTAFSQFQVSTPVLPLPRNVTVFAGTSRVALTWRGGNNPQIFGYRIYRSASAADGFTLLDNISGNPGVYFDSSPLAQGYYYLTAVDAKGNASAASATVSAQLGGTGIAPQLGANTITARAGEAKVAFSQSDVPVKTIAWQIERGSSALIPLPFFRRGWLRPAAMLIQRFKTGRPISIA